MPSPIPKLLDIVLNKLELGFLVVVVVVVVVAFGFVNSEFGIVVVVEPGAVKYVDLTVGALLLPVAPLKNVLALFIILLNPDPICDTPDVPPVPACNPELTELP